MAVGPRLILVAGALLVSACGGTASDPSALDESAPYLRPAGPLGALALVGATSSAEAMEPQLLFDSTETEVNAILALGQDVERGATLEIAWYRRTGDTATDHLFSHRIEVGPLGRARSQAIAPSGILPGTYEAVATVGDWQVRTLWVARQGGITRMLSAASQAASALEPGRSDFDPRFGSLWEGGWEDVPPRPPPAADGARACTIDKVKAGTVSGVEVHGAWSGNCSSLSYAGAFTGEPRTFATLTEDRERTSATITADYCQLPGGSDLPGAAVTVAVTDSGGATGTASATLRDLGEIIIAALVPTPDGGKVDPGETIQLLAQGFVFPPALGIEKLDVVANDELLATARNDSGGTEPRGCDDGRLVAKIRTQYVVPASPPPVIDICARVVGFDWNKDEECRTFTTGEGEVWSGTMDGTITIVPPGQPGPVCPNPVRFHGEVSLVVAEDGATTGSVDVTGAEPPCIDSFDLTGTKTDRGFSFPQLDPFFVNGPIPIVGQGRAEARATHDVAGTTKWVTDWKLSCSSCAAGG